MVYLITNITDATSDPVPLRINDIPNRHVVTILPGHSIDLEILSTRNQIEQSAQIPVMLAEGRASLDTMGTGPSKRWYVDIGGQIQIDSVEINEPIAISAFVNGVETNLTGTTVNGKAGLNVVPLLPKIPTIVNIPITSMTPVSYTIPNNSRRFLIKTRGCSRLSLAYQSGGSQITIPQGSSYEVKNIDCSNITLFMSASKDDIVEIETWKYS